MMLFHTFMVVVTLVYVVRKIDDTATKGPGSLFKGKHHVGVDF